MTTAAQPFSAAESEHIRQQFPILGTVVHDKPLVYLDSAATSQRPSAVMDAERNFLETSYGAVHRGAHTLAETATEAFEAAREAVAGLVGAGAQQLVWTRNATEGINLLAYGLSSGHGPLALREGDEVLVTEMEHHANLVPWQQACERTGAQLRWIPVTDEGRLDYDAMGDLLTSRTKVVAFTQVSNVLGTVNEVNRVVAAAKSVGALTVLDACQSAPHLAIDLAALGVDAAVFSAHKMCGPTGIGALVATPDLLAQLPVFLTGGSMVNEVTMEHTTFREPPQRFEAGTQAISQAVAWHAAVEYLTQWGMGRITAHEHMLAQQLLALLADIDGVRVLGPRDAVDRTGAVSFDVAGVHPHDVGQFLDAHAVAARVGHHCAQPIHRRFGVHASTRASVYLYNTPAEIDHFAQTLAQVRRYFGAAA